MKRRYLLGLVLALVLATVAAPQAQSSVAAQINSFWNLLKAGATDPQSGITYAFTTEGLVANGYINWGTVRSSSGYGIRDNNGTIEFKNNGGAWGAASGGASPLATYLVKTATNAPVNAQVMGSLGTGLVLNTTTTGVQSIFTGTSCTNQFPRSLSAAGVATCATVDLATDVTGTLPATSFPALSGDITTSAGSTVTTLATVTSGASRGSATSIPTFTVDAKGRLTASGAATPQLTLTSTYFSSLSAAALTNIPGASITGTLPASAFPALTGDVTTITGSLATTVGSIGGQAVSLGSPFTVSGAGGLAFTITGATAITLPTSGTLVSSTVSTLSSLSSIGTISTGVWQGTLVAGQYGGTGVANTGKTITLGGNLTTSGAFATTFTVTGATNITLPTSGTMISNTVTTLSSLVSIGTITTGTWTATPITVPYGGCGQSSFTAYAVLAGGTTTTGNCQQVSGVGTSGQVLTSNGAAALPTWQAGGGTGTVTHTAGALTMNQIVIGNAGADIATLGSLGTTTTLLHGNAAGAPTFGSVVLTTDVSGLLPGGNGGTGVNNGSSTITLGGSFTTSGAFTTTLTVTGNTNVTLPNSGTLVNSAVTTLSSLVSIGTVTSGTWSATPVTVTYGGCGQSSFSTYAILAGGTTSTGNCQQVSGLGSAGQVLTSAGAGALPTWTSAGAGTVTATAGNLVSNQIVIGNGTTDLKTLGTLGTTTTLLHGNAGGAPTFGAVVLTTDVTGTLPFTNGGFGIAIATSGAVPYFSSTTTVASSALWGANALALGGGAGTAPFTDSSWTIEQTGHTLSSTTQPRGTASNSGLQAIGNAASTAVTFDTNIDAIPSTIHNTGSNTSRFVAPIAGFYQIEAGGQFAASAGGSTRFMWFRKNGTTAICTFAGGPLANASASAGLSGNCAVTLATSDYIELMVFQDSGGNLNFGNNAGSLGNGGASWLGITKLW